MKTDVEIADAIAARLTRDRRVRTRVAGGGIRIRHEQGRVILEGEVETLAEKFLSERLVSEMDEVVEVENRLRIRPVPARTDDEIILHLRDALSQDRQINEKRLSFTVANGLVTLTGQEDALAKKRLAGLIAWWIPGVTDVRNEIQVIPHEEDSDDEITEAVRMAFEKDRLVDSIRFQIWTRRGVVSLAGVARNEAERDAAEEDAWAIWGVKEVDNQIHVER